MRLHATPPGGAYACCGAPPRPPGGGAGGGGGARAGPRGCAGYRARGVGLIQHKREAYWFYRFLSLGYDRWVNPLFWTPEMRDEALRHAALDDRALSTVDVGAGTGFTTEGIVGRVD